MIAAALPGLSESVVRQSASADSFQRGQQYYRDGAVLEVARRGDVLEAEVEGSMPTPYRVRVTFDAGGITLATCTCPYNWGGWCKHIVATLLTCVHEPEQVEERPAAESLLADLSRDELQAILLRLATYDPDLVDDIEREITHLRATAAASPKSPAAAPAARRTAVDSAAIRGEVRASLHSLRRMRSSEAYWHVGAVVQEVGKTLQMAWEFIHAGDGPTALTILEAITDEYVKDWTELDDSDGYASGFFQELGEAYTEAILSADLTPAERDSWARKLEAWDDEVQDYGVEDAFDAAAAALERGWDDPTLLRELRGEVIPDPPPQRADDDDDFRDFYRYVPLDSGLTNARLNVLEHQGRVDEYLNLARAHGLGPRYTAMLVRLGRGREAVEYGLRYFRSAREIQALAEKLRAAGEMDEALRIAPHGLDLTDGRAQLASWLRDVADAAGQPSLALRAALLAAKGEPSLAAYLRAQELAGSQWDGHRSELLDHYRQTKSYSTEGQVDVFLHEGLIDDAIAAVDRNAHDSLVARVADDATASRPDWVIAASRRRAETIMGQAKSDAYDAAVDWLARARAAYQVSGRQDEWRAYLEDLIGQHQRKYKLRPMLEALRT